MTHSLICPLTLKNQLSQSTDNESFIKKSRSIASDILLGNDPRIVCIVGPCSIHDVKSARDYAERLKYLSHEVKDSLFLVMRVYCEKPRTKGNWKGLLYDPDLDGSNDIAKGLFLTRRLLLDLTTLEVPCAAEFLDPLAVSYFDDLITWGFIGARTASSQTHRQLASSFAFPIGFKNNVYGEIDSAINGILTARQPHVYLGIDESGSIAVQQSEGNPWTHLVLRGSESKTNYDPVSIATALETLNKNHLEPRLMIDCSHGNSGKDHRRQRPIFDSILHQIKTGDEIFGLMLESHLLAGKQPQLDPQELAYGCSITDPCIGWEETEELLLEASALLSPTVISSVQK